MTPRAKGAPDANLIAACARFAELSERWNALFREVPDECEREPLLAAIDDEREPDFLAIITTPACTLEGARAKLAAALSGENYLLDDARREVAEAAESEFATYPALQGSLLLDLSRLLLHGLAELRAESAGFH